MSKDDEAELPEVSCNCCFGVAVSKQQTLLYRKVTDALPH